MKILGIETSCDETAISLIEVDNAGKTVHILGNTVHSQIDLHVPYGGVFPMLAKREHAKNLVPVLKKTLTEADACEPALDEKISLKTTLSAEQIKGVETILALDPELLATFKAFIPTIKKPDIDFISVTVGPGLEPALWVGISFAKALSYVWNIPVVPANHMEGHVLAALIEKTGTNTYNLLDQGILHPALSLLISGGHTQIIVIGKGERGLEYGIVGETRDDAVGECFDKAARMLGLPYPGGPKISQLAAEARAQNIQSPEPLPRPMIKTMDFDFSFSGLKTAVLYLTQKLTKGENGVPVALTENQIKGIAREVEDAITDVVVAKVAAAAEMYITETLIVGGGVIANTHIRKALETLANNSNMRLLLPQTDHATDNGLMIALAGYFGSTRAVDWQHIPKASGNLPIGPRIG
jgi:N6-L-threonylcarbamoyladenine synthase